MGPRLGETALNTKPIIIVSKCLGFAACRYNGVTIRDPFVEKLKPHVEFRPVCPEVEIGLGVPREPIRVVSVDGELRLIQPATMRDVTEPMRDFAAAFLASIQEADGFILKSRSPSCGIKDVKIYPSAGKVKASERSSGFFGGAVLDNFPYLAVEDEGRLTNYRLRQHFLTKLFAFARFREVKAANAMRELVQFHAENKYLLMSYSQMEQTALGRIVANREKRPVIEVIKDYETHLRAALTRAPKCTSNINILMHIMGHFSEDLSRDEKAFFLQSIQKYRAGKIPLTVPLYILKSYMARCNESYIRQQTFFRPYPEELVDLSDSSKDAACPTEQPAT